MDLFPPMYYPLGLRHTFLTCLLQDYCNALSTYIRLVSLETEIHTFILLQLFWTVLETVCFTDFLCLKSHVNVNDFTWSYMFSDN
jgi:hypothetical protein